MKKNLPIILAAALALSSFVGCSAPSSTETSVTETRSLESIAQAAADTLNSASSMKTTSKLVFSGTFSLNGVSTELDMSMSTVAESVIDPASSHITQTMLMSYLNQSYDQTLEFYTVDENGTSYTYTGNDGVWAKSTTTEEAVPTDGTIFEKIVDGTLKAELSKETVTRDDQELYEITLSDASAYLKDLFGFSLGETLAENLNLSDLTLETKLYVYTDTLKPASISISCKELGQSLFEALVGLTDLDFSVDTFTIEFIYDSFNDIDEIVVPDDVKALAEQSADTQTGSADSDSESSPEVQAVKSKIESAEDKSSNGDLPAALNLSLDSDNVAVPLGYSELTALDWTVDDSADGMVAANDYDLEYMTDGDNKISVYIYNPSDSEAAYEDCEIIGIYIYSTDIADASVSLPSNISLNSSTLDDVLSAYGKPDDCYVDDSMIYIYYSSDDANKIMSLYFSFDGEVLNEIEVQDMSSVAGTLYS